MIDEPMDAGFLFEATGDLGAAVGDYEMVVSVCTESVNSF